MNMPSTTGRYKPGVGLTITRANIAILLKKGVVLPESTAERVAEELCGKNRAEARHVARAARLIVSLTDKGKRAYSDE